jgi:hypothetical protein
MYGGDIKVGDVLVAGRDEDIYYFIVKIDRYSCEYQRYDLREKLVGQQRIRDVADIRRVVSRKVC